MTRVFVSHASADLAVASEIQGWLQTDGHTVFLAQDLENGVRVGEVWKQRLHTELRSADVVVCLVSKAFTESNWCAAEVGIADCLGCRLAPVRIDGTTAHPLMETLQYADYHADQDRARQELVAAVQRVDTNGRWWRDGQNPFPGLKSFTAERASMFFGRDREIKHLTKLLRSPTVDGWVVVTGQSGCGKSSVVQAGVLPSLDADHDWLVLPSQVPGTDPVGGLAMQLAAAGTGSGLSWSLGPTRDILESDSGSDGLRRLVDELLSAKPDVKRVLVPVDQAEELFTRADRTRVDRFAQLLAGCAAVQVVATLRPEFLGDMSGLAGVHIVPYLLPPLGREMLRLAIEQPARRAGLVLEPELTARMLDETGTGEALPLLAFVLHELADGRSRGDMISDRDYKGIGGVHGALASQADSALHAATAASGMGEQLILHHLVGLAYLDDAGRHTRRRVPYRDGHGSARSAAQTALREFVRRGLLTVGADETGPWVTVTHEAFLTAWRPLADALAGQADRLRAFRSVELAAADWTAAGRDNGYLWDGDRLAAARIATDRGSSADLAEADDVTDADPVATAPVGHLSRDGREFLDTSHRQATKVRTRRRRQVGAAFVAMLVLTVTAVIQWNIADSERAAASTARAFAQARLIASTARQLRSTDPALAMQISLVAYELMAIPETRGSLLDSSASPTATRLPGGVGTIGPQALALDAEGHLLAAGGPHGGVHLTDVANPPHATALNSFQSGSANVYALAFSPSGHLLAVAGADGTVRLWDVTDPMHPRKRDELVDHSSVQSMAFAPAGDVLAVARADGTTRLWDMTDADGPTWQSDLPATPTQDGPAALRSVAFSPHGATLAVGGDDSTVRLWDVRDPAHPVLTGSLPTRADRAVFSLAFSPQGGILAVGGADGALRLYDVVDVTRPSALGEPLTGASSFLNALAFDQNGANLAAASSDGTVRVWDLRQKRVVASLAHPDPVTAVVVAPDGRTLISAGTDGVTRMWTLPGPVLTGPTDKVFTVTFSPDGHLLAAGSNDGRVWIWDVTDPAHPAPLGPLTSTTPGVRYGGATAFSPNGRLLAAGSIEGPVQLWDLTDPAHPAPVGQPLQGPTDAVQSVTFSPDGKTLAAGGDDQGVHLWDVTDPRQPAGLPSLTGPRSLIWQITFSPDGTTLAAGSDDRAVHRWDLSDLQRPAPLGRPLAVPGGGVFTVAYSPDGKTLAAGSNDQTVRLWDVTDPRRPQPLAMPLSSPSGHPFWLTFSPDGRTLAAGNTDHTVSMWDVTDPTRPHLFTTLTGPTDDVLTIDFSPNGEILAASGLDATVRMWTTNPDQVATHICAVAGRPITREEWDRNLPEDLDYAPPC